ncbi:MAG: 3-oxoacyl-(acyl-carrier-protein) reductase [Hydrocarboniphaga sp.]|uniref:SDR family oxidoreductase n=1 Tax=Hydrocarboniphaga sp. TaxID=2033016 RepID=UPI002612EE54|nr:SDR family oxidoreductase [Hydrocarboniphaga sp.]MDB5971463.1 3-oxoacyl-(acyl-carrier-protein) reductase [Hydrocarboniphaga sp.]
MDFGQPPLLGKVAVVTGGSRGIGAAIVRRLARDGASVVFTYAASSGKAEAVARSVIEAGGKAVAVQADSGDVAALRACIEKTAAEYGRLDILVNNAAVGLMGLVDGYSVEDFDRMMAVNVRAPFFAAQAAARHMQSGGRIVIIGSAVTQRAAFAGMSVYAATKGAVAAMVRGLALDLAPRGITVNNVQPGPTATDAHPSEGPQAEAIKAMMPIGRMGSVDEIAGMAAYLVSVDAAFVTGASLTIDGGFVA